MKTLKNGQNGSSSPKFTHEQLLKALHNVEDLFESLMAPFVLMGETAQQVASDSELSGSSIVCGVRNLEVRESVLSTLKTKGIEVQPNGFTYYVDTVPVHVKFIRNRYKFFEFPDKKMYQYGDYYLPNPFEEYWEMRWMIR